MRVKVIINLANGQRFTKTFATITEARIEVSGLTFPVAWVARIGGEVWTARANQYPTK